MKLYNTQSRELESFDPLEKTVRLYVCGITPYDTTHLGHAATYCTFDVLVRYLEYQGATVNYCENVTDIDDDTIREAPKRGTNWRDLGNYWTAHFMRDMIALNVRPPDHYPRATEKIPEIIEFDKTLIEKGFAYESGGQRLFPRGGVSEIRAAFAHPERGNAGDCKRARQFSRRPQKTRPRSILSCGKRNRRANRHGIRRGVRDVRAGTSNARR